MSSEMVSSVVRARTGLSLLECGTCPFSIEVGGAYDWTLVHRSPVVHALFRGSKGPIWLAEGSG